MKTKLLTLVFVAIVFVANVFATEIPQMEVFPMNETKLLIAFVQETPVINQISIYSKSGDLMYVKRLKKGTNRYSQIYDLSQIENGNYEVRLKYGKTTLKKEIKISDGDVRLVKEKAELPPVFTSVSEGVNLSYMNFEKNDVSVFLYKQNELLDTANLGSEFLIHKRINLTALKKGNYDILLACADKKYWFSVQR